MMMQIVGSFAECEARHDPRARISAGLALARSKGRSGRRRKTLNPEMAGNRRERLVRTQVSR
ncbi:hypothetical protein [Bosea sp. LC85]|uniref:hypothetical protein n=1 Tax=Bosea sp. LC85 TaxID=1502851 RepID=UPI00126A4530|nr:hypothetical protein [Bosea sp. LC85]